MSGGGGGGRLRLTRSTLTERMFDRLGLWMVSCCIRHRSTRSVHLTVPSAGSLGGAAGPGPLGVARGPFVAARLAWVDGDIVCVEWERRGVARRSWIPRRDVSLWLRLPSS